jgi:hypothetical protein
MESLVSHGHHTPALRTDKVQIPEGSGWTKLPLIAGGIGILGLGASFALAPADPKQFYFSYMVAFMYFLALGLGCLFFVLIQFAARAGWSVIVRRIAELFMATLPVFAVLFIPIAFGMHDLFHWTHEDVVANDKILAGKAGYLNTSFFFVRAAIYLLGWAGLALWYYRTSTRQDETGDHELTRKMQARSAPAIAFFALSVTFAAIDWIMSLDPHWYSTMFGVYYFAGAIVSAFSLLALFAILLQRSGLLGDGFTTEHLHDLGKLCFAFTVFWAYIAFSQYMLIWYANIPEETLWYEHRWTEGWKPWTVLLAVGHFAVPFFYLMPRTIKRIPAALAVGAVWTLFMEFVDLHFLIMPVHHHGLHLTAVDFTTMIGVGGIFFAVFGWLLQRHATVPLKDPRLTESLAFENF